MHSQGGPQATLAQLELPEAVEVNHLKHQIKLLTAQLQQQQQSTAAPGDDFQSILREDLGNVTAAHISPQHPPEQHPQNEAANSDCFPEGTVACAGLLKEMQVGGNVKKRGHP